MSDTEASFVEDPSLNAETLSANGGRLKNVVTRSSQSRTQWTWATSSVPAGGGWSALRSRGGHFVRVDSRAGIGLLDYRTGALIIEQRLHTLVLSPDETIAITLPYLEPFGMTTLPERQVVRHALSGGAPKERVLRDLRGLQLPPDPDSDQNARATVGALLSGLGATFCLDGSAYAVSVLGDLELRRSSDDAILATAHVAKDRAPSFTRSGRYIAFPKPFDANQATDLLELTF